MKSRFVGDRFLKQAIACKWLISSTQAMPWRGNFLIAIPSHKECEINPSREQKNAAVFANRISWRKSQTLQPQKSRRWLCTTKDTSRKKQIVSL